MKVARETRWENVARVVKGARKRLKLSQVALAKRCEVSPGTVAGWETARHGIQAGRVGHIAQVLQVEVAELVA